MARYIDADALKDKWLEEMMRWSKETDDYCDGSHWTDVYADFIKELVEAPTVDAVEVVRCKDCFENDDGFCYVHGHGIRDDEFCSWGVKEKKSSDDDSKRNA